MNIKANDNVDIEQNFKVEAGPGSGKTEFLVNHIKNVIHNSKRLTRMRKVLCITYTNIAVETILNRLGTNAINKVNVSTIHSFLYKNIIKPYCSFIPSEYNFNFKKINGHDEFVINTNYVEEWLNNKIFDNLNKPNRKQLITIYKELLYSCLESIKCTCGNNKVLFYINKNNGIGELNLQLLSDNLLSLKNFYWREGILDHNDVLYFSYILIEKYPFILDIIRSKYPYIFIDEYQDTNSIQSYIINEIKKKETVVGVIGDKAQSIYSFQNADVSLFDNFQVENKYKLEQNYRSSSEIVKLLNDIRKDLTQKTNSINNFIEKSLFILIGTKYEAYNLACKICENDPVDSVVTLSRTNNDVIEMKAILENYNINHNLLKNYEKNDSDIKRRKYIISFMKAIESIIKNSDYKKAFKILEQIYGKEKEVDSRKLLIKILSELSNKYSSYSKGTLMEFYNIIYNNSNIEISRVKKNEIKNFYKNTSYENIANCINPIDTENRHITIHKAKGSEYNNVMIIQEKPKIIEFLLNPDLNKEEHRITYVAISRAKNRLFIYFNELSKDEENKIRKKYEYIDIIRL